MIEKGLGERHLRRGLDIEDVLPEIFLLFEREGGAELSFGERLARKEGEEAFRAAGDLLLWWLARMIRSGAAGSDVAELVPGESEAMRRLLAGRSLDRWLELWEKTARLFARTESAYLDRKQVWIAAFLDIEGLARS